MLLLSPVCNDSPVRLTIGYGELVEEATMRCARCEGLMVPDHFMKGASHERNSWNPQ